MKYTKNIITIFFILSFIITCEHSDGVSKKEDAFDNNSEFLDTEPLNIRKIKQNNIILEKITLLHFIGEIKENISETHGYFFSDITSICVDNEDNLYIADSKLHQVFKFNSNHEFLFKFGQSGQGPGEFINRLSISFGKNGLLYISDQGNLRFSIFKADGSFIQQFPLSARTYYDTAIANSKGDIFLLSENLFNIIDCYDNSFRYKQSLLGINYHLNFPIKKPPSKMLKRMFRRPPRTNEVHKLLSTNDNLIIALINSQVVVVFDQANNLISQFSIDHPRFIKDFKNRVNKVMKERAWIISFGSVFLDEHDNICLCYYNDNLSVPEVYRYTKYGKFIDTLRIESTERKTNRIINACDRNGNFYSINRNEAKVDIYCEIN